MCIRDSFRSQEPYPSGIPLAPGRAVDRPAKGDPEMCIRDSWYSQIPEDMLKEDKFLKLASHKGEDVASEPVQNIVEEIIAGAQATAPKLLIGGVENYCRMMIDTYSNDYLSKVFDTKHGAGSSEYIVKAFRYYSENHCAESN